MYRTVLKFKNYDVHSITACTPDGRRNANIATWVMQTALGGKMLTVALYEIDYTIELVRESGLFNVNLLAQDQTGLIQKLGRKSGRDVDKFRRLPHALDDRGCPYLTEAVGYVACRVTGTVPAGDHTLFVGEVLRQVLLHPEKPVLTNQYLRERGLVRG
jgi:flavin reductase (DIM6/NTAB) family NADH-FMN oxidoreductase RutF